MRANNLTFSGQEAQKITIKIYGAKPKDLEGLLDIPNLKVQENSIAWEKFLNEEISIFRWLLTRTIKLKGSVMFCYLIFESIFQIKRPDSYFE
jgi:hypothetical protein